MAAGRKRKNPESQTTADHVKQEIQQAITEPSSSGKVDLHVHPDRIRELRGGEVKPGPVIYWMSRDQRSKDNWALLYACEVAQKTGSNVVVAFNLVTEFLDAGARQWAFLVEGLKDIPYKLEAFNIPFYMMYGKPEDNIPKLVEDLGAGLLVCDYVPLHEAQAWRMDACARLSIPMHQVDAHNVVPVWLASNKKETAARTIRKKIHSKLPTFLTDFPETPKQKEWQCKRMPDKIDWDDLMAEVLRRGTDVPALSFWKAGEDEAYAALLGDEGFLSPQRLKNYNSMRNDPCSPKAVSTLSAYLHFGQISGQRVALEASKHRAKHKEAVESFLEEVVVRRELCDNYCHYEPNYHNLKGAAQWAQDTLEKHKSDPREYIYTKEQLEFARTDDELWNAAQREMLHLGKCHGFMRMYWAKKASGATPTSSFSMLQILEWTNTPEEALDISLYLNNKYEMDGRDPNGYVGCMWSVAGVHDMGWTERPIFGKIRYMNYNGCKRKFDVNGYIKMVNDRCKEIEEGKRIQD